MALRDSRRSRVRSLLDAGQRMTTSAALLRDVDELVRQQATTCGRIRAVAAARERDVFAQGKGARAEQRRRTSGVLVGMQTYAAEVLTEPALEEGSLRCRQRLW
jgi:hypothetical protein